MNSGRRGPRRASGEAWQEGHSQEWGLQTAEGLCLILPADNLKGFSWELGQIIFGLFKDHRTRCSAVSLEGEGVIYNSHELGR